MKCAAKSIVRFLDPLPQRAFEPQFFGAKVFEAQVFEAQAKGFADADTAVASLVSHWIAVASQPDHLASLEKDTFGALSEKEPATPVRERLIP
jgi:hypothetical protein